MQKPLFVRSSPGMVKAVPLKVCDRTRNITGYEAPDIVTEIPETAVPLDRAVIVSPSQLNSSMNRNYSTSRAAAAQPSGYAEHGAKTAKGAAVSVELASGKDQGAGFDTDEVSISFRNESAASQQEIIFDAAGFLRGDSQYGGLGIGASPAPTDLVIDGTFGPETLTRLENLTRSMAVKVEDFHFLSERLDGTEDTSMYTAGKMRLAKASSLGNAPHSRNIRVSKQLKSGSFNKNIRTAPNLKAIITALDGIAVTIPAGIAFTITFNLTKVASGSAMEDAQ